MLFKKTKLSQSILLSIAVCSPSFAGISELSLPQLPLRVTEYVEPNVMLLLDTSGSMGTLESGVSRMDIVKDIATDLIENNKDIRFCLARFRFDQGGKILSECGSSNEDIAAMKTAIAGLSAGGSTPLAEAYWEVINYFAGSTPKYIGGAPGDFSGNDSSELTTLDGAGKYTSPIQYRCQKNYAIVMTDGVPQLDSYFPGFPSSSNKITSIHPFYSEAIGPDGNYAQESHDQDGNGGSVLFFNGNSGTFGVYEYLDDLAKYAWDSDLRDTSDASVDKDITGESFDDTRLNNEKQNLNTYTVGFTLDIDMLRRAADYGKGGNGSGDFDGDGDVDASDAANDHYYSANNRAELEQAFQDAIDQIVAENQSSAQPTVNSDVFSGNIRLFQTSFTNNKWTGHLAAYSLAYNGSGAYNLVNEWTAPSSFPSNWQQRVVYSGINGGVAFTWDNLTTTQKSDWFNNNSERLNYVRGKTAAQIGGSNYRVRESLMGDIVNSSPLYVGPPQSGEFTDIALKSSYNSFASTHASRAAMIYTGANDGLLHGFNTAGDEKMTFAPNKVIPNLAELSETDYGHLFYVDGAPSAANVYAEFTNNTKSWKTILVGGLRRGGQGIYAIDITNPALFSMNANGATSTFLWEFSDDETTGALSSTDKYTGDKDLGYSYAQPQIIRLNDGEFYVALGSGYNNTEADGQASTTGDAVLFLLNVATGEVVKKISTGYGIAEEPFQGSLANGLATVKGYDAGTLDPPSGKVVGKADGKVDFIYAGDLYGNVWKFNLASVDPQDWDYVAEVTDINGNLNTDRNPVKLFTAKDSGNKAQPITVQIQAHTLQSGEIMLYFGTGKLLEQKDTQVVNISGQTFYGIADNNELISGRTELLEQRILTQQVYGTGIEATEQREVTTYTRDQEKGWYIDLETPVNVSGLPTTYEHEGEQVVVKARVEDNVVYFVTGFADQDACLPPVKKDFLMTLAVRSGSALTHTLIDTNADGVINDDDNFVGDNTKAVSGRTGFGSQLPIIIQHGENDEGTKEGLICNATNCYKTESPGKEWRRTSWKKIKTN